MHVFQLHVQYYMSEMSKWFDVHFAMSKISKGKILKLSLVPKFRKSVKPYHACLTCYIYHLAMSRTLLNRYIMTYLMSGLSK